jgi:predicted DNA-binding transcriptional regulator AlpA
MTRYIRAKQIKQDFGIDRTTAWKWSRSPEHRFPKVIRLSHKVSVYDVDELEAWFTAHRLSANEH